MKLIFTFLLIPFFAMSQIQIGEKINGSLSNEQLGRATSLSEDGKTIAIGAPNSTENGIRSGLLKVYEEVNNNWIQKGQTITNGVWNDAGKSVSLSSDGTILAAGFPGNRDNGTNSGMVRVYKFDNGMWMQIGSDIKGDSSWDYSGWSLSLSNDGNIIAIGAPQVNNLNDDGGKVKILKNINNNWIQLGNDLEGAADDEFGWSVSLSNDGNTVAVGARRNHDGGVEKGKVQIFNYNGTSWIQKGQNLYGLDYIESFGNSVSLSDDGNTVAIGAPYWISQEKIGTVYVYQFDGVNWVQKGMDINGQEQSDRFGYSVSLSSNGNLLAIGAPKLLTTSGAEAGFSQVYKYSAAQWEQIGTTINGEGLDNFLGYSVSLSKNGEIVAVSEPRNDDNGENSGQITVFSITDLLSINSPSFSNTIKLYPNPTENLLHIQSDKYIENIKIYSLQGQQIKEGSNTTIDVSALSKGLYFVQVSINGETLTKKFIKS
jgi:hypothetical protein